MLSEPAVAVRVDVPSPAVQMSLLGRFRLEHDGTEVTLPDGAQRLLAFMALQNRTVQRHTIAGTLWPEATEVHATSSLRSTLTRMQGFARTLVTVAPRTVGLSAGVSVDLWEARAFARRLLAEGDGWRPVNPDIEAISLLSAELLPDWLDDWAIVEAEEWRQLRLHALEAFAARLTAVRRFADAAASALAAVRAEPLRESARAALIRVHIAEGNPTEALREFDRYSALLDAELGVEPTDRLRDLVALLWPVTLP